MVILIFSFKMLKFFMSSMERYAEVKFNTPINPNRNHLWPGQPNTNWCDDWTDEVLVREKRLKEIEDSKKPAESWEEEVRLRELSIPSECWDLEVAQRKRSMGTK